MANGPYGTGLMTGKWSVSGHHSVILTAVPFGRVVVGQDAPNTFFEIEYSANFTLREFVPSHLILFLSSTPDVLLISVFIIDRFFF